MTAQAKLISDLEALLAIAKSSNVDELDNVTRLDMLAKVEEIHHELDDPVLAMYRQLMNYTQTAAIRTALEIGALKDIPRDGTIGSKELAARIGVDEQLLVRIMRPLTATKVLRGIGDNTYAHTTFSLAYIDKSEVDFFNLCMNEVAPVAHRLPEYIASHTPTAYLSPTATPFSWANDREGKNFYEILLEQPDRLARFNEGMMTREAQHRILGLFPLHEIAERAKAGESERAFIVDVAGGRGQSLLAIRGELGEKSEGLGKWILQERKGVLDSIPDSELVGIEKMPIDFFEPQPVKGAHIYYLRRIMHNWQDLEAQKILRSVADAMALDSTLLIGEMVIPKVAGVNKYVYMMDMCMLVIGGKERTENDFSNLLESSGLILVKVWLSRTGNQAVIECRLK